VLAVTAVALGLGQPVAGPASTVAAAGPLRVDGWAQALADAPAADPGQLRAGLPLGYGTVAARAAHAAAVAEADAAAAAAAEAAAAAAAATASAPRATTGAGAPAGRRSTPRAAAPTGPAVPAPPSSGGLPLGLDPGGSQQVVTVVAASSGATTAKLTAWQRGPAGWTAVLGPVTARVGSAGIGRASETTTRTPAGTFSLTEAFGRSGDPGTALPYRVVDGDDWWVSDVASPRYNQYAQCAPGTCDFNESAGENLFAAGAVYDHAVVIDYNRGGTPGAGSAFFLHVSNGAPTAGCVAIDAGTLVTLLRWLDPGARPVIAIGVG
jgi:L,D-peptidoglycan transpeptidase YkuD (ErfK/YbiS/YcfS/YnhG family)